MIMELESVKWVRSKNSKVTSNLLLFNDMMVLYTKGMLRMTVREIIPLSGIKNVVQQEDTYLISYLLHRVVKSESSDPNFEWVDKNPTVKQNKLFCLEVTEENNKNFNIFLKMFNINTLAEKRVKITDDGSVVTQEEQEGEEIDPNKLLDVLSDPTILSILNNQYASQTIDEERENTRQKTSVGIEFEKKRNGSMIGYPPPNFTRKSTSGIFFLENDKNKKFLGSTPNSPREPEIQKSSPIPNISVSTPPNNPVPQFLLKKSPVKIHPNKASPKDEQSEDSLPLKPVYSLPKYKSGNNLLKHTPPIKVNLPLKSINENSGVATSPKNPVPKKLPMKFATKHKRVPSKN